MILTLRNILNSVFACRGSNLPELTTHLHQIIIFWKYAREGLLMFSHGWHHVDVEFLDVSWHCEVLKTWERNFKFPYIRDIFKKLSDNFLFLLDSIKLRGYFFLILRTSSNIRIILLAIGYLIRIVSKVRIDVVSCDSQLLSVQSWNRARFMRTTKFSLIRVLIVKNW